MTQKHIYEYDQVEKVSGTDILMGSDSRAFGKTVDMDVLSGAATSSLATITGVLPHSVSSAYVSDYKMYIDAGGETTDNQLEDVVWWRDSDYNYTMAFREDNVLVLGERNDSDAVYLAVGEEAPFISDHHSSVKNSTDLPHGYSYRSDTMSTDLVSAKGAYRDAMLGILDGSIRELHIPPGIVAYSYMFANLPDLESVHLCKYPYFLINDDNAEPPFDSPPSTKYTDTSVFEYEFAYDESLTDVYVYSYGYIEYGDETFGYSTRNDNPNLTSIDAFYGTPIYDLEGIIHDRTYKGTLSSQTTWSYFADIIVVDDDYTKTYTENLAIEDVVGSSTDSDLWIGWSAFFVNVALNSFYSIHHPGYYDTLYQSSTHWLERFSTDDDRCTDDLFLDELYRLRTVQPDVFSAYLWFRYGHDVSLPSLLEIDDYGGQRALTMTADEIRIPSCVWIGNYAFYGESSIYLTKIEVSPTCIVGSYTFQNCVSLESFSYDETKTQSVWQNLGYPTMLELAGGSLSNKSFIGSYAFQNCTSLKTFRQGAIGNPRYGGPVNPDYRVHGQIGMRAFDGCYNLSDVQIDAIGTVNEYAFRYCYSLSKLKFYHSAVFYADAFEDSGLSALYIYNKSGLWWYELPDEDTVGTLATIDGSITFEATPLLDGEGYIILDTQARADAYAEDSTWGSTFDDSQFVWIIDQDDNWYDDISIFGEEYLYQGADRLLGVHLSDKYENDPDGDDFFAWNGTFGKCTSLVNFSAGGMQAFGYSDKTTGSLTGSATAYSEDGVFQYCTSLTDVDLPSLRVVSAFMFYQCQSLTDIEFPTLEEMGSLAFMYSGLTNLILSNEDAVATCDSTAAFQYTPINSGEGHIHVPYDLLDEYAEATTWTWYQDELRYIVGDDDTVHLDTSQYADDTSLGIFESSSVSSISSYVFQNCTSLYSVTLPESYTVNGYMIVSESEDGSSYTQTLEYEKSVYVFQNCTNLRHVEMPGLRIFKNTYMFDGCENLEELTLPMCKYMDLNYNFRGCTSFDHLVLASDSRCWDSDDEYDVYVPASGEFVAYDYNYPYLCLDSIAEGPSSIRIDYLYDNEDELPTLDYSGSSDVDVTVRVPYNMYTLLKSETNWALLYTNNKLEIYRPDFAFEWEED